VRIAFYLADAFVPAFLGVFEADRDFHRFDFMLAHEFKKIAAE
jgi:hypothetical protein